MQLKRERQRQGSDAVGATSPAVGDHDVDHEGSRATKDGVESSGGNKDSVVHLKQNDLCHTHVGFPKSQSGSVHDLHRKTVVE